MLQITLITGKMHLAEKEQKQGEVAAHSRGQHLTPIYLNLVHIRLICICMCVCIYLYMG